MQEEAIREIEDAAAVIVAETRQHRESFTSEDVSHYDDALDAALEGGEL